MKTNWVALLVAGLLIVGALWISAITAEYPTYTLPTTESFIQDQAIIAAKQVMKAFSKAQLSGYLEGIAECPCYDVNVASSDVTIFLNVERGRCD